jgi:hypothetical protein
MEFATRVVVLVHLLGFASLMGGLLVQAKAVAPEVNGPMLAGAWLSLLSGAALVALLVVNHGDIHYGPLAVKLFLTLVIVLLVGVNRKFLSIPRGLWALLTGFALANAGVAVLWQ